MKNIREFVLETKNGELTYLPGEILRGQLYITLEEEMEVKSIKLFLQGEGAGDWLEQSHTNLTDKRKNTDGKLPKRTFLDIGLRAFGESSKEDKIPQVHPKGRYVYEFQFRIPKHLPSTFKSPVEKDLGYVRYYLKAILSRPRKYNKIAKFTFVINELISPDRPELSFLPGSSESKPVKSGCVSAGTLFLEGCLSKSYYAQGENIMMNVTAENESTKVMKELYAKLIRRVRCKGRFGTKTYIVEAATKHGDRVPPEGKLVWKSQKLAISAIGPTITGNSEIRVDYFVRVGMYEDYGSEIHIDLPVVIGIVGTEDEVKRRQEAEEKKEWERKRARENLSYKLKLVKDGEQREDYRDILQNKLGPPEEINVADEVWSNPLMERGRKITFDTYQERGSGRERRQRGGKAASHSPSSRHTVDTHNYGSGRRSASADGPSKSKQHGFGRVVLGGKLGSSKDKLSSAGGLGSREELSGSRGSLACKGQLSGSKGSSAAKKPQSETKGSLSKRALSGSKGLLSASNGSLAGSNGALSASRGSLSGSRGLLASKEGFSETEGDLSASRRSVSGSRTGLTGSREAISPTKSSLYGSRGSLASKGDLSGSRGSIAGSRESISRLGRSGSGASTKPNSKVGPGRSRSNEETPRTTGHKESTGRSRSVETAQTSGRPGTKEGSSIPKHKSGSDASKKKAAGKSKSRENLSLEGKSYSRESLPESVKSGKARSRENLSQTGSKEGLYQQPRSLSEGRYGSREALGSRESLASKSRSHESLLKPEDGPSIADQLMQTEEGRNALQHGIAISREGRRRLTGLGANEGTPSKTEERSSDRSNGKEEELRSGSTYPNKTVEKSSEKNQDMIGESEKGSSSRSSLPNKKAGIAGENRRSKEQETQRRDGSKERDTKESLAKSNDLQEKGEQTSIQSGAGNKADEKREGENQKPYEETRVGLSEGKPSSRNTSPNKRHQCSCHHKAGSRSRSNSPSKKTASSVTSEKTTGTSRITSRKDEGKSNEGKSKSGEINRDSSAEPGGNGGSSVISEKHEGKGDESKGKAREVNSSNSVKEGTEDGISSTKAGKMNNEITPSKLTNQEKVKANQNSKQSGKNERGGDKNDPSGKLRIESEQLQGRNNGNDGLESDTILRTKEGQQLKGDRELPKNDLNQNNAGAGNSNEDVIGNATHKSPVTAVRSQKQKDQTTTGEKRKKAKGPPKKKIKGTLLNPLDTSADERKYLEEFEQLEEEFKAQSARRYNNSKSSQQSPVENYDEFQESGRNLKKPFKFTGADVGNSSQVNALQGSDSNGKLMRDDEPYEPYDNNDMPMSPIREVPEIENSPKKTKTTKGEAKQSNEPSDLNETSNNKTKSGEKQSKDSATKETSSSAGDSKTKGNTRKTTKQAERSDSKKASEKGKPDENQKKVTGLQQLTPETTDRKTSKENLKSTKPAGTSDPNKTQSKIQSGVNHKNGAKSQKQINDEGSTISLQLAKAGDEMMKEVEDMKRNQVEELDILQIDVPQFSSDNPTYLACYEDGEKLINAQQQELNEKEPNEHKIKTNQEEEKDKKDDKTLSAAAEKQQKDDSKINGNSGNKKGETKMTAWGFIGGAVGKFLGKLKPKQEKKETEEEEKGQESKTGQSQNKEDPPADGKKKSISDEKESGKEKQHGKESGNDQKQSTTEGEEQLTREFENDAQSKLSKQSDSDVPKAVTDAEQQKEHQEQNGFIYRGKPDSKTDSRSSKQKGDSKSLTPRDSTHKNVPKDKNSKQTKQQIASLSKKQGVPGIKRDTEKETRKLKDGNKSSTVTTDDKHPGETSSSDTRHVNTHLGKGTSKRDNHSDKEGSSNANASSRIPIGSSGTPNRTVSTGEGGIVGTPSKKGIHRTTPNGTLNKQEKNACPKESTGTSTKNDRYGQSEAAQTPKKDQVRPRLSSSTPMRGRGEQSNGASSPARTPTKVKASSVYGNIASKIDSGLGKGGKQPSTPTRSRSAPSHLTPEKRITKPRGVAATDSETTSPTKSRGRGRSPTKKPYGTNSAKPRSSKPTAERASDGSNSDTKYSTVEEDSLEGSDSKQFKHSSGVSTPSKTPTKRLPSYQGYRGSPKYSPTPKPRSTEGNTKLSTSPAKKRSSSSGTTKANNLPANPRSASAGGTPTRPGSGKKTYDHKTVLGSAGIKSAAKHPGTISIPHGKLDTGRHSSSLSSIDSLMSNTEVHHQDKKYKLYCPPEKPFGSMRYPSSNTSTPTRRAHASPLHQQKIRNGEHPQDLFNKEAKLSSGPTSTQTSPHHQAKTHPELGTAVQRQKHLDEMLMKTGRKSNTNTPDHSPSKKKSRPRYVVRDESPGFIEEYLHSPSSSTPSSRHNSPMKKSTTPKSPARFVVTQSPDSSAVTPLSPIKNRSNRYKHIESPTKKLMYAKPKESTTTTKSKRPEKGNKPSSSSTNNNNVDNNNTRKPCDHPVNKTYSREGSPLKSRSPIKSTSTPNSTPSKKGKPHFENVSSSSKIPTFSPRTQQRKSTTRPKEKSIQFYSYNPDAESSDEKVTGTASQLSFTEQQLKHGSPELQRKQLQQQSQPHTVKEIQPTYQSPYRQIPRRENSGKSPSQYKRPTVRVCSEIPFSESSADERGRPSSRNNGSTRAKSENDLISSHPQEYKPRARNAVSLDTKCKPEKDRTNQKSPTDPRRSPSLGRKSSTDARKSPSLERKSPALERKSPSLERKSPSLERKSPSVERNSSTSGRRTPTSGRKTPTCGRKTPTSGRKSPTKGILKQKPDPIKARYALDEKKPSLYDQCRELPTTLSSRLNRSYDPFYNVEFTIHSEKQRDRYSKSPDSRINRKGRRNSGEHCDTPRPKSVSDDRLSSSYDHLSFKASTPSPYNKLRTTNDNQYSSYHRPFLSNSYTSEYSEPEERWRRTQSENYRYLSSGLSLPRPPYQRIPYDELCSQITGINQADLSSKGPLSRNKGEKHDYSNNKSIVNPDLTVPKSIAPEDDRDCEGTLSQFMEGYECNMEDQQRMVLPAAPSNNQLRPEGNQRPREYSPKNRSPLPPGSNGAYEDWLKNEYLPPRSAVVPPSEEFCVPKTLVQPSVNPFHKHMEKEKYVPRSSVVPLMNDDYYHERSESSPPRKQKIKSPKQSKLPIRKGGTPPQQQHVSFNHGKLKKKPTNKLTQNKNKPRQSDNARTSPPKSPEKCSYDNSLDVPDPYTQQFFQNTSNKLIQGGIVPVNYFPIVCSSHLPKKIGSPKHGKYLSHKDNKEDSTNMPRSKSNSPERSRKLQDDTKKRSRSHSPQKKTYGLDEQDNKRQRLGSLNKDKMKSEENAKYNERQSKVDKINISEISQDISKDEGNLEKITEGEKGNTSKENASVSQNPDDASNKENKKASVKDNTKKNESKSEGKSKIPKTTTSSQQPKKKKKGKTVSQSWPSKRYGRMSVKSPRAVLRDERLPGRNTYYRAMQKENFVTPPDFQPPITSYQVRRSNENLLKASNEAESRHDSTENGSYDKRICIGGGLSFHSPTKTSKQHSKKTTTKLYQEDFTDHHHHHSSDQYFLIQKDDEEFFNKKIEREMAKQNLEGGMEIYTFPKTSCGYTRRTSGIAYEIPFESGSGHESHGSPQLKKKKSKTKPYDTQARDEKQKQKKSDVIIATPVIMGNETNNGVMGAPFLSRYEKLTKKQLEERMKQNVVIAKPIEHGEQSSSALPPKVPGWFEEQQPETVQQHQQPSLILPKPQRNGLAVGKKSKEESFDSFEQHEKCFGIIDEHGQARSNTELLTGGEGEDETQENKGQRRHQRSKARKNQRLLEDLEEIRHQRRSSCPATVGLRDGLLSVSDDHASLSSTVDSMDELKANKSKFQVNKKDLRSKEIVNTKTQSSRSKSRITSQSRSTTSSRQIPLEGFGYEEEIIETYEHTEDRPILTQSLRNNTDHDCLTFDIPMVTSEPLSSVLKSPDEVSVTSSTNTADEYGQCSDRGGFHKDCYSYSHATPSYSTPSSYGAMNAQVQVCEERSSTMAQRRSAIPRWRNFSNNS